MRVLVIGAGLSGLAAACHLRGAGHEVVVLEREDEGGTAKVNVTTAADKATIVMDTHIAREGEMLDEKDTATLDLASCAVAKQ